jgi:hypothetical protein
MNKNKIEIAPPYTKISINAKNSAPNNKKQIPLNKKVPTKQSTLITVFFENIIQKDKIIIKNNII